MSRSKLFAQRLSAVTVLAVVLVGCSSGGSNSTTKATATALPASGSGVGSAAAQQPGASAQKPVPVESNPPGDIPDNVAFVPYRSAVGHYSLTVPEGWARSESGSRTSFTEKLNGLTVDGVAGAAPDPQHANGEVTRLQRTEAAFELVRVEAAPLPAGPAVRIVYRRNSSPDPVTGRQYRDEVVEYLVGSGGRHVQLDLFGPVGADNVDAYRTISSSLRIS